jgi:hypothetical protein
VNLVAIVSSIRFLDGKPKRGNLALEYFEADSEFPILDAIHHFVERALEPLQDRGDEKWVKHRFRSSGFYSIFQSKLPAALPNDQAVQLGGDIGHTFPYLTSQFSCRFQILHGHARK